jgi:hypothetical protein
LIKELEMFGLENELQEIFSARAQGKKYFGHAPPKPDEKTRKKSFLQIARTEEQGYSEERARYVSFGTQESMTKRL